MKKIELNIKGLNLAHQRASKEQLLEIAKTIFPVAKLDQLAKFENCYSELSWNSNLERLFKESIIDTKARFEFILRIENPIMRMHQTLNFIEYLTTINEIDFTSQVIESLKNIETSRTKDTRSLGHRKILGYFAEHANLENFILTLKLCEISKERNEIQRIKFHFVNNYSKTNSLEETLKVVQHKVFGKKYILSALKPNTEKASYRDMKNTLDKNTLLKELDNETKVQLLAETFYQSSKIEYKLSDFNEIYEKVFNLDPKIRIGDVKLRDWLLMQIGSNLKEIELVIKCRKAIKNNNLKKELRYVEDKIKMNYS